MSDVELDGTAEEAAQKCIDWLDEMQKETNMCLSTMQYLRVSEVFGRIHQE